MATIDWNDKELLQEATKNSKSRVGVLEYLGYDPRGTMSRRKLNAATERFSIDISHFSNQSERWNILPDVIHDCFSVGDVLGAVGLQDQGDNFKTAKRRIKEMNLDTSHFCKKAGGSSPYTHEEVFCEDSRVIRSVVRNRVLKETLLPYECQECKLKTWRGAKITLDLDHINGINNDHRLENLRFLCPNCHSVTPTHRGKSRRSRGV